MGAVCCKGTRLTTQEGSLFCGGYNTGRGLPQVMVLGPEGSGKTTLMYSTVIPGWSGITTSMEPTVAFHYEEIQRSNIKLGIWDISGSSSMQPLWPLFYRFIAFDGLVFVVSVLDSNLNKTREWIRRLLNEDELRTAQIVIVLNTFDQNPDEIQPMVNAVASGLGLEELNTMIDHPDRFGWFVVNAKEGERDPQWQQILFRFMSAINTKYTGQGLMEQPQQQQQEQLFETPQENGVPNGH